MISAINLAKYVVRVANEERFEITSFKLQRILYLILIEYLKKYHRFLFPDSVEAWLYGPVIRSVYIAYQCDGTMPLREKNGNSINALDYFPAEEKDLIDHVISKCFAVPSRKLMMIVRNELPYLIHKCEAETGWRPEITHEEMKRCYEIKE